LVLAALVQKLHGVDTVLRPVQLVKDLAFLQRLARQALIARVVLHQQDLNGRAAIHHGNSFFGSVKWGVRSLLRNLSALPIRFWNTCASCTSSPSTVGSASAVTAAPDSWIAACKL